MIKKKLFYWKIVHQLKKLLTCLNEKSVVIIYPLQKVQIVYILSLYFFIPLTPLIAFESKDYLVIDTLVKCCYKDVESCNSVLLKIYKYQKNAAMNKKFSCQTRLLGLEANLIMAINSNLKRKDANSIIKAVKKYC